MKDIKGERVGRNVRAITCATGTKKDDSTERGTTVRGRGRLIYAAAREGKNYERNATGHRATPNLICPHPRPPLGFANKITLKDIEGTRGD